MDTDASDTFTLQERTTHAQALTPEGLQREKNFRLHHALKRTGSLLGEDYCSDKWISESRSNYTLGCNALMSRQRPDQLVNQLDRDRRHKPHPRLANSFNTRPGQRPVTMIATLLPEERRQEVTEKSAYTIEFQQRPLPPFVRWKSPPIVPSGILPNCRIPMYDDIRQEILLPMDMSPQDTPPSTQNPNKYMCRRRRVSEHLNQHRSRDTPYGSLSPRSAPPGGRIFSSQGRPLIHRRHVTRPPSALPVVGFDGGAKKLEDTTMHAQLLPYLRGPKII